MVSPDEEHPKRRLKRPRRASQAAEPDVPLTKEEFVAQMRRLTERARAAGLNPLQVLARTYARQGMVILEGLLGSLENADSSKGKK